MGWVHAQGRVVKGLVNRRTAERKLCLEGVGQESFTRVPAPKPEVKKPPKAPEPPTTWEKIKLVLKYIWKGM